MRLLWRFKFMYLAFIFRCFGLEAESMNRCECVKRLINIFIGQRVTLLSEQIFCGSPLLSDRSMWKGTDYCRLLFACIVLTLYLCWQSWQLLASSHFFQTKQWTVNHFKLLCSLSLSLSITLSVSAVHRLFYAFFLFCALIYLTVFQKDISGELESNFFVFVFALKPIRKVFESHFESRIESNQEEIRESNRISKLDTCLSHRHRIGQLLE